MANLTGKDKWIARLTDALRDGKFVKLSLSGYRGGDEPIKSIVARRVELRSGPHLSFVYRYPRRDVTKNFPFTDAVELLDELLGAHFQHAHLFTTELTSELDFRDRKGSRLLESRAAAAAPPSTAHDQEKSRLIAADQSRWLHGLGVTTPEGRVARGMEAKFRQINKFVEVLGHLFAGAFPSGRKNSATGGQDEPLTLVDMGCGKGYLTFAAYEWLQRSGWMPSVRGVEERPELVELGNRVAQKEGMERLTFEAGTIASAPLDAVDVLVALHACDTATDDAIARGVQAGASLIVVSPCCHKEVRPQLQAPPALAGALQHGILLERHAEFVTDALRAALLEWAGYDTKVFEFISTEHTGKNLMIAATKRPHSVSRDVKAEQVRALAAAHGIRAQRLASHLQFPLEQGT